MAGGQQRLAAALGNKLGKQTLEEIAIIVKPETILTWHRKLIAKKFDGSSQRKSAGRPTIDKALETLVVRMDTVEFLSLMSPTVHLPCPQLPQGGMAGQYAPERHGPVDQSSRARA